MCLLLKQKMSQIEHLTQQGIIFMSLKAAAEPTDITENVVKFIKLLQQYQDEYGVRDEVCPYCGNIQINKYTKQFDEKNILNLGRS